MDLAKKTRIRKDFLSGTLVPLILLIGTISVFYFVGYPRYNELPTKNEAIKNLTEKDSILDNKLKKLSDLNDFKEVLEENSKLLDSVLPSYADVPLLLSQIQQITGDAGLEITNLGYSSSSETDTQEGRVDVQLAATGNFNQVKAFLTTLEKAARLVDISTIRLTASEEDDQGGIATSKLEIALGLSSPFFFVESKATTEDPINIDLNNPDFVSFINSVKDLKIYHIVVDNSNIGKENPFGR